MEAAYIAGAAATGGGALAWLITALYQRLVALLDETAKELRNVAVITAAHGARIDALERG